VHENATERLKGSLLEQLPSVRHIARRIHERLPQHVPLDDLVQAGVVGLIDAHRKFDPAKRVQFPSYAKFRIRGAILDSLRELDWSPRELRKQGRAVDEAVQRLSMRLGRMPGDEEIACELCLSLPELQQLLRDLRNADVASFTESGSEQATEEDLSEQLRAAPDYDPSSVYERAELNELLLNMLGELPEKEGRVLYLYYFEELSMKEIGEVLGVGESRISQIHSAAMARVRVLLGDDSRHPLSGYSLD
jgi:RNA polymerase sigma factor for flagellar operon FliA